MKYKSELLNQLSSRGYIKDCTNIGDLDLLLSKEKIAAYIGFDCTAQSLHVGNLLQIMIMRMLMRFGHQPIIILGTATSSIGDPSDKKAIRRALDNDEIASNRQSILSIIQRFLPTSGGVSPIILDNINWIGDMGYLEFLREYGRYFSINKMLTFDTVKARLEQNSPLSFLEFNYMLLQAYDFLHLNKEYGCKLQFGGSEQWGNIVNGIDLVRRVTGNEVFGLTSHIITKSDGSKMGKTADGAVWLKKDMLSPYDYWQFWRNVNDDDVIKFLLLYSDLGIDEISKYSLLRGAELNEVKVLLADKATEICHGSVEAALAKDRATSIFVHHNKRDADSIEVEAKLLPSTPIYKLFVLAKLCSSLGEAKRLIVQNGAKLNDAHILDHSYILLPSDYIDGFFTLSAGKKRHVVVKLV